MGCHALSGDRPFPGIKTMFPVFPALIGKFFTDSAIWEAPSGPITSWQIEG